MIVAFIIPCGADHRNEKVEPSKGKMPEKTEKTRSRSLAKARWNLFSKKFAEFIVNFT